MHMDVEDSDKQVLVCGVAEAAGKAIHTDPPKGHAVSAIPGIAMTQAWSCLSLAAIGTKLWYGRRLAGRGAAGPFDKLRAEHERRWVRRRLGGWR